MPLKISTVYLRMIYGVSFQTSTKGIDEVLGESQGAVLTAKATYHEIVKDLSWLNSEKTTRVKVQRAYGEAIDVSKSINNLVGSTIEGGQKWQEEAQQSFAVTLNDSARSDTPLIKKAVSELQKIKSSPFPGGQEIVNGAMEAYSLADDAFKSKMSTTGNFWLESGAMFADLAIGFIPVASVFDDLHSVIIGKSLFERRELSNEERAIAMVGVVTLGLGSKILSAGKLLEFMSKTAMAYGVKKAITYAGGLIKKSYFRWI